MPTTGYAPPFAPPHLFVPVHGHFSPPTCWPALHAFLLEVAPELPARYLSSVAWEAATGLLTDVTEPARVAPGVEQMVAVADWTDEELLLELHRGRKAVSWASWHHALWHTPWPLLVERPGYADKLALLHYYEVLQWHGKLLPEPGLPYPRENLARLRPPSAQLLRRLHGVACDESGLPHPVLRRRPLPRRARLVHQLLVVRAQQRLLALQSANHAKYGPAWYRALTRRALKYLRYKTDRPAELIQACKGLRGVLSGNATVNTTISEARLQRMNEFIDSQLEALALALSNWETACAELDRLNPSVLLLEDPCPLHASVRTCASESLPPFGLGCGCCHVRWAHCEVQDAALAWLEFRVRTWALEELAGTTWVAFPVATALAILVDRM